MEPSGKNSPDRQPQPSFAAGPFARIAQCISIRLRLSADGIASLVEQARQIDHDYSPPLILEHLTTSDGLPQGTVFVTLQDSQGFVWLGTEDGLVRYDGHELLRYAYSRSARGGLPGNYIQAIVEDARHDLWIAIKDEGVARWNRATDSFTVYRHDAANPNSLASNAVHDLLVDGAGRIWIGTTDAGIDILDPASTRIEHLRHDPNDPTSLIDDRILSLALDRSGGLWIGTDVGLDHWEPGRRAFTHFQHEAVNPASLSGNQVSRVLEDPSGAVWVGTYDGGLNRMDRDGRVVEVFRHNPQEPTSLGNDDVRAILADHPRQRNGRTKPPSHALNAANRPTATLSPWLPSARYSSVVCRLAAVRRSSCTTRGRRIPRAA